MYLQEGVIVEVGGWALGSLKLPLGLSVGRLIKLDLPPIGSLNLPIWMVHYMGKPYLVKSGSWYTENPFLRKVGFPHMTHHSFPLMKFYQMET